MVITCRACGTVLPEDWIFKGVKQSILRFVQKHPGCTMNDIMDYVYGNTNKIPDTKVVSVHICQMRPKMHQHGIDIVVTRGPHAVYRLVKLEQQNGTT